MKINFTKEQCESLIDYIEMNLLDVNRKDKYIDNLCFVKNILTAKDEIEKAVDDGAPELISRNSMRASVALHMTENASLNDTALDVLKMIDAWLIEAPGVDAVKVVRCKDCENYCPKTKYFYEHCSLTGMMMKDDDFCSYGRGKE